MFIENHLRLKKILQISMMNYHETLWIQMGIKLIFSQMWKVGLMIVFNYIFKIFKNIIQLFFKIQKYIIL